MSIIIVFALVASFTTCYFATPTVFGGRDQGAIATAAINLAKYKTFTFSTPESHDLFQKYGPGKALNYPGFDYTKNGQLVTRFPKAYIVYLAGLYSLFGLKGIQFANFIPLFLFFVLFWLTLRQFFSEKVSFLGFLIAATFFPFLWFAKYALTEIFMLFLVWAGIYFLLTCRRRTSTAVDVGRLQLSLAAFGLSALTRIEGIVFFALAVIYIFILDRKKIIHLPKNFFKLLLFSILFLAIIYSFLNYSALFDSLKNIAKAFLPNSTKDSAPSANLYAYLARIFFSYNILIYFIFGIAGIAWLAAKIKKNWTKPEFLIIFILFPSFFYLISPLVSLDDPWLFRRFVFAVFPMLIFYSIFFLNRFFYHKIFLYLALAVLIAANSVISWRFLTLSENRNLLPQIEKISRKFGFNDLVMVDRMATGSGFSLMSEPMSALFGKNAVYFFNTDDLGYIDQNRYKNIYLVAPLTEEKTWYADLVKGKTFDMLEVDNNFLEPSEKKWGLARNIKSKTLTGIWKVK
ncbi:MAG: glycosyltransferase family 39 protein [Patescibacteria group bacterium]|nr:glycosyltransferase family 39 protein [Patescibacteria group bacterium]